MVNCLIDYDKPCMYYLFVIYDTKYIKEGILQDRRAFFIIKKAEQYPN